MRAPRFANSPAETSDFCRPELWRVRQSRPLQILSSSLWGGGWSCVDSSSPSGFHVLNWKRAEKPPVEGGGADGSDRKLLPELRKVQATSWGCVHEKVTLPWRTTEAQRGFKRRRPPDGASGLLPLHWSHVSVGVTAAAGGKKKGGDTSKAENPSI